VEQYRKLWTARLDSLDDYLKELQSKKQSPFKKRKKWEKMNQRTEPFSPVQIGNLLLPVYLNAPRELVWKAWTDPKHLINWFGPKGFTNTFHEIDIKPGGVWKFTMHGPDGTDYPNLVVFDKIVRPEYITYTHGSFDEPEMLK
jgi:hypothetical protein